MIKKLSQIIYNFMSKHISVDEELEDVYRYGIEITLSSILNIFLVMSVSVLLGNPLTGLSYLGSLILLKSFCGGYHANSYFKCNSLMVIFYIISYIGANLLAYYNLTDFRLMSILLMLAFLPIYAYAPVKNKHKPLSERKAKRCRVLSIIIYILLSLLGLFLNTYGLLYGSIIIITLIEISVMILVEILIQRRHSDENSGKGG